MNWDDYANFSPSEFQCKGDMCCMGSEMMKQDFMDLLQELRDKFERPMVISSGYRCPLHNSRVSSTGGAGPHTTGKAADVLVSGEDAWRMLQIAMELHFTGIGVKQHGPHEERFLHLDLITTGPRPFVWSYK